jgi:sporulation protein YlmC with PRC-barrel domain
MLETHGPGSELPNLVDHEVTDEEGNRVGKVTDVISDRSTLEPRWMVVDPGPLRKAHYVPVTGAYLAQTGQVVIPFAKELVMAAPKAGREHVLTSDVDRELVAHYHI